MALVALLPLALSPGPGSEAVGLPEMSATEASAPSGRWGSRLGAAHLSSSLQEGERGSDPIPWRSPEGAPLPFRTHAEILEFLAEAKVIRSEPVGSGITDPTRVLLQKDGIQAWAQFQDVDEEHERVKLDSGEYFMTLTDSYRNDCAAYEMARLLGIENVPPMVERRVDGAKGRLQIWLEGVITEGERVAQRRSPSRHFEWIARVHTMYLFDDVIGNVDRNAGNILLDQNFDMWLIDHTRAFQLHAEPRRLGDIKYVDREVWDQLRRLERGRVEERLGPYLSDFKIDALMRRVGVVLEHVESLIETLGEDVVLVEVPPNGSGLR